MSVMSPNSYNSQSSSFSFPSTRWDSSLLAVHSTPASPTMLSSSSVGSNGAWSSLSSNASHSPTPAAHGVEPNKRLLGSALYQSQYGEKPSTASSTSLSSTSSHSTHQSLTSSLLSSHDALQSPLHDDSDHYQFDLDDLQTLQEFDDLDLNDNDDDNAHDDTDCRLPLQMSQSFTHASLVPQETRNQVLNNYHHAIRTPVTLPLPHSSSDRESLSALSVQAYVSGAHIQQQSPAPSQPLSHSYSHSHHTSHLHHSASNHGAYYSQSNSPINDSGALFLNASANHNHCHAHSQPQSGSQSPRNQVNDNSSEQSIYTNNSDTLWQQLQLVTQQLHQFNNNGNQNELTASGGGADGRSTHLRNCYVDQLPIPFSDHELRLLFQRFGSIEKLRVATDLVTGEQMGYGFVMFQSSEDAQRAIAAMNGLQLHNKILHVSLAKQKNKRPSLSHPVIQSSSPSTMISPLSSPTHTASMTINNISLLTSTNTNVYLASIPHYFNKAELDDLMAPFGRILESRVLIDRQSGEHRGIGFVRYEYVEEANAAIQAMNGKYLPGSAEPLIVKLALGKQELRRDSINAQQRQGSSGSVGSNVSILTSMAAKQRALSLSQSPLVNSTDFNDLSSIFHSQSSRSPSMTSSSVNNIPSLLRSLSDDLTVISKGVELFVFHLASTVTDEILHSLFSAYGPVQNVCVMRDRRTGEHKGFGFVNMLNRLDAELAVQQLQGFQLQGKYLKVSFKTQKQPGTNGGNSGSGNQFHGRGMDGHGQGNHSALLFNNNHSNSNGHHSAHLPPLPPHAHAHSHSHAHVNNHHSHSLPQSALFHPFQ